MGSRLRTPAMNTVVLLLLVPLALAQPQNLQGLLGGQGGGQGGGPGSLRDKIQNIFNNPAIQSRVLNSEFNPCQGRAPSQCSCTNGVTFAPLSALNINQGNPCGGAARPDVCTCPAGNQFRADEVVNNVANKYQIPTCGKGVEPTSCVCRDGSTSGPGQVPCGGNPFQVQSCSCPDGKTIDRKQFISAAVPLLQDIL